MDSNCRNLTMIGDWDVDKYQSPTEPRHHWAIKKKFMEAHKDRYQLTTSEQFSSLCFSGLWSVVYGFSFSSTSSIIF